MATARVGGGGGARSLRHVRVLHFEGVRDAFGGFDSAADAAAFASRAAPLLGEWCCIVGDGEPRTGAEASHTGATRCGLCRRSALGSAAAAAAGGRAAAAAPSSAWAVTRRTNNILGGRSSERTRRAASLGGGIPSLDACIAAAEARPALRATSVMAPCRRALRASKTPRGRARATPSSTARGSPSTTWAGRRSRTRRRGASRQLARPPAAANASSRWMRDVAPHVTRV